MGREAGGYWKGFDFADDFSGTISSLKTIDPTDASYATDGGLSKIKSYIDELDALGEVTLADGEIVANKILDVRVPKGTKVNVNIEELEDYANRCGIKIVVKEF